MPEPVLKAYAFHTRPPGWILESMLINGRLPQTETSRRQPSANDTKCTGQNPPHVLIPISNQEVVYEKHTLSIPVQASAHFRFNPQRESPPIPSTAGLCCRSCCPALHSGR